MEKEISSEWTLDCHGCKDLDYNLFARVMFRIAHSWAVHVDYEEYAFLLNTIYDRVTCKALIKARTRKIILPKIKVSFPEEEKKFNKGEEGDNEENKEEGGAEWTE